MAEKTIEQLKAELEKVKQEAENAKAEAEAAKDEANAAKAALSEKENETIKAPDNDDLNKRVKYTPPLVPGVLEDDLIVIHKGVTYQMARGKECEIPQKVLNVINRSTAQKLRGVKYASERKELYMKSEKYLG